MRNRLHVAEGLAEIVAKFLPASDIKQPACPLHGNASQAGELDRVGTRGEFLGVKAAPLKCGALRPLQLAHQSSVDDGQRHGHLVVARKPLQPRRRVTLLRI